LACWLSQVLSLSLPFWSFRRAFVNKKAKLVALSAQLIGQLDRGRLFTDSCDTVQRLFKLHLQTNIFRTQVLLIMAANKLCCTLAIGALLCLGFAALIQAQGELNTSKTIYLHYIGENISVLVIVRETYLLRICWDLLLTRNIQIPDRLHSLTLISNCIDIWVFCSAPRHVSFLSGFPRYIYPSIVFVAICIRQVSGGWQTSI